MSLADQILRKLLDEGPGYEQHHVDLEMGVFDCRIDLTDDEIAYCQDLIDSRAVVDPLPPPDAQGNQLGNPDMAEGTEGWGAQSDS